MLYRIALVAVVGLAAAGCSKSETAQAHAREGTPKAIQAEPVRQDSVKRTVDVVGTLAAVDEVTISSEADGKVAKILADLRRSQTASKLFQHLQFTVG